MSRPRRPMLRSACVVAFAPMFPAVATSTLPPRSSRNPSRFLEAGRRYFEGEPGVEFSQANSRSITWVSESSVDGFLGTGSQHQAVLSGLEECVCGGTGTVLYPKYDKVF